MDQDHLLALADDVRLARRGQDLILGLILALALAALLGVLALREAADQAARCNTARRVR